MSDADDLLLEICDSNWNRLFVTPNVQSARISDELGTVGEGEVTIPIDDEAIPYVPDPDSNERNEGRWRLYEGNELVFSGVVDQTTKRINPDNTFTFGGKQRGILLGNNNMGRRDFNGWPVDLLFDELLRDNIGRAPIATIISHTGSPSALHPPINAVTGDPTVGQYWAASISGSNYITIDLGSQVAVDSVRVIPPYWDRRWYKFNVQAASTYFTPTLWGEKTNTYPLSDRGQLFTLSGSTVRYIRVTVTDSSDSIARLASVMVFKKLADRGTDTTFNLSWIENDDSGNVTTTGGTARILEQGAFNGDGILGNSLVTRLSNSATMTQRFRGTASSVYLTQGESGGACRAEFYIDGVLQDTVTIPANTDITKYQYKAYEKTGLSDTQHTITIKQVSGTPQVDYFTGLYRTAYRPINEEDPSVAYTGYWAGAADGSGGPQFRNGSVRRTSAGRGVMKFEFEGDLVKVIGTKGPSFGYTNFHIDDAFVSTADLYNSTEIYQQTIFQWSGSYGNHSVMAVCTTGHNPSTTGTIQTKLDIDGIEGNFAHVVYLRSFYETNLRLIDRMSQITNSFNRFNPDGTIDYLGSVGTYSNTVIREGENEGGTIINADIEDDYTETCSAVLALVTSSDGLPLKAFVIDKEAVGRMGLKVRKLDNADANDAYLLTRQAWVELQDHKYPARRYNVQYDETDVGDIQVGDTTKLYSTKARLDGTEELRVGRMDTEYSSG